MLIRNVANALGRLAFAAALAVAAASPLRAADQMPTPPRVPDVQPTPEPASLVLIGTAVTGLYLRHRKGRKK